VDAHGYILSEYIKKGKYKLLINGKWVNGKQMCKTP
jgi:hypothetical protein